MTSLEINGRQVEVKVGGNVLLEGATSQCGRALLPGDSFSPFRLECHNGGPIKSVAVAVDITGRTFQKKLGSYYVRVAVRFIGDGEPDTTLAGWLFVF